MARNSLSLHTWWKRGQRNRKYYFSYKYSISSVFLGTGYCGARSQGPPGISVDEIQLAMVTDWIFFNWPLRFKHTSLFFVCLPYTWKGSCKNSAVLKMENKIPWEYPDTQLIGWIIDSGQQSTEGGLQIVEWQSSGHPIKPKTRTSLPQSGDVAWASCNDSSTELHTGK